MLKKISILSLLVIIGFSQIGYYIIFRQQQAEQKRSVKKIIFSQMKDDELTIISFTDNVQHIFWVEEGKEFHYKGEMYDVVRSKTINGKVLLYCINDKIEKNLIDKYNLVAKHNSSGDKKGKINFNNSINLFVYADEIKCDINFIILTNTHSFFDSELSENIIDKVSPPPKA